MVFEFKVWRTAIAGLLFQAFGMGMIGAYGFYIQPLAEHFDKDHATLNLGLALLLLLSAFASPILGRVIDRTALKPVLCVGAICAAVGLYAVSEAGSFPLVIAAYLLFAFGIVLYGPLVCNLLIVRAYQQHRARALAIAAIGVSIASVLLPLFVAYLLETIFWQSSLKVLALVILVGVLGSTLFLVVEPERSEQSEPPPIEGKNRDQSKAFLQQVNFWLIGLVVALVMSIMALLAVVLVPHFQSLGLSTEHAAWLMASMGVLGLIGKLSLATLSDRIGPFLKPLAIALACIQFSAWLLLFTATETALLAAAMFMLGFTNGLFIPLLPYIASVYFEESVLGRVNGAHMAMMLPFSLLGPWLAGRHFDQVGNYLGVFAVLMVAMACVVVALALLRPPPERGLAPGAMASQS